MVGSDLVKQSPINRRDLVTADQQRTPAMLRPLRDRDAADDEQPLEIVVREVQRL